MAKYRVDSDLVYEYDEDQKAYIFIGKLNGEDFDSWIQDYEDNYDEYNETD